jgi:hypothetical protein
MRSSWRRRDLAGLGALLAMLLLSGPGVEIVRADGPPTSAAPAGPVCSAAAPAFDDAQLRELERRLEELRARAPGGEPATALNTRGYGYAVGPEADLDAIRRDLTRIQREAR